ncbi:MAG: DnaB-like helicase N-terminal domain-containing protein, partial [Pikeienuella sp.]
MPVSPQGAPHSIEAEQQLLGALLCNPEFIEKLGSKADPDIFHDPVHQDIFKAILKRNSAGDLVSPVAMRLWADAHPGCKELGGGQYLVRLAGASISSSSVPYYVSILAEYRAKRAIKTALDEASVMISEDGTKAAEIAARLESALIVDTVAGSDGPVSMMQAVTDAIEQADDAYHNRTTDAVLSGVPALDRILGGFYPGELILLGGRPSMGKTAVALSMALNVARSGGGVAIA